MGGEVNDIVGKFNILQEYVARMRKERGEDEGDVEGGRVQREVQGDGEVRFCKGRRTAGAKRQLRNVCLHNNNLPLVASLLATRHPNPFLHRIASLIAVVHERGLRGEQDKQRAAQENYGGQGEDQGGHEGGGGRG